MTVTVRWGVASHVGCVRTVNQDSVLARPPIFAVADGMGGHAEGEVASALAVEALAGLDTGPRIDPRTVLRAIRSANRSIRIHAAAGEHREGMGTTIAGLALSKRDGAGAPDVLLVFNVGDSRTYQFRAGRLTQVSVDHSLVAELVEAGVLDPEEAAVHPRRNVITRALGAADVVHVDTWLVAPRSSDRYVLCSDGLTNEVGDELLAQLLAAYPDPQGAADALLATALGRGARDNVSVVVVLVDDVVEAVAPNGTVPPDGTGYDDEPITGELPGMGPITGE
jgi:PPM family protein phosphatase